METIIQHWYDMIRINSVNGHEVDMADYVAEQLRDRLYQLSYSADELEQIEDRLDTIHRLRRKYGATCEDILAFLASAQAELDEMEFFGDRLEQLKGYMG